MIEALAIGLATFAVVCASPGPAVLAVVSTAMARGFAPAMALTVGLSLALGVWGVLAAAGFAAVLAAAPSALIAFKIAGGAYLLWLAYCAGRSSLQAQDTAAGASAPGLRAGLMLNLSNPKAVFAWTATIAVGTPPDAPGAAWILVPLAIILTVAIYAGYALVFSRPVMRRTYGRARRWIEGTACALFALAGLALIRDGLLTWMRRA